MKLPEELAMQMKKRKVLVGVALVAAGVVALVATGALVKDNKSAAPQGTSATAAKPGNPRSEPAKPKAALTVTLVSPTQESWPRALMANGSIVPWQEAVIGAELGGLRLTEVLVNVGDVVKRGQLLARIDNDTLEAELAQAKAAVDEAVAMNVEAMSNAKRTRQLREQNFISDQQVTQTAAQEQAAAARLAAARARLKSSQLRLAQTRVEAPDAGVISGRHATVGSLTQPGQELFRLIRQNRLEWRAEVTAGEIARVRPGQVVSIVTAGGVEVKGKVRIAAPTVDAQTRNGLVYVDLPPSSTALAGTFARGQFDLGQAQALVLPQSAVLLRDGFSYVYQMEGTDRVQMTKVTVGRRVGDRIEILEGLKPDARVVATGAGFLADGDSVRVVDAAVPVK